MLIPPSRNYHVGTGVVFFLFTVSMQHDYDPYFQPVFVLEPIFEYVCRCVPPTVQQQLPTPFDQEVEAVGERTYDMTVLDTQHPFLSFSPKRHLVVL